MFVCLLALKLKFLFLCNIIQASEAIRRLSLEWEALPKVERQIYEAASEKGKLRLGITFLISKKRIFSI